MAEQNASLIEYLGQGDYLQNGPMSVAAVENQENGPFAAGGVYSQVGYAGYQPYANVSGYNQQPQAVYGVPNFEEPCLVSNCCRVDASCAVSGQPCYSAGGNHSGAPNRNAVPQNCHFVNANNNNNASGGCCYTLGPAPTSCMGQVAPHHIPETDVVYNARAHNNPGSYLPRIQRKDLLLNERLSGGRSYALKRPRNNHFHTMEMDSASSPEQDFTDVDGDIKKRGPKKRKKKGANEPQKPVSAYALFFRDTQAAIKAENPNATFGEISKIVASMWDSLSEEAKQVYKQKTESAKRDYLKQLAAFRANLVSRGGLDADDDEVQPLSVIKVKLSETNQSSLPPMPKLQMAPPTSLKEWPTSLNQIPETNLSLLPKEGQMSSGRSQSPSLVVMSSATANGQAPSAVPISPGSAGVIPPPIQLRSIVPKANSPVAFLPSKPGQIIKVLPASQAASIAASQSGKTRIIKMADMLRPVVTQPANTATEPSPSPQSSIQPILQMIAQENEVDSSCLLTSEGSAPKQPLQNATDNVEYIDLTSAPPVLNVEPAPIAIDENPVQYCIRDGCNNVAVSNPQWNKEYCSNECVVSHCRDVFDAWASARNVSASVN